jgi:hypothetical protein
VLIQPVYGLQIISHPSQASECGVPYISGGYVECVYCVHILVIIVPFPLYVHIRTLRLLGDVSQTPSSPFIKSLKQHIYQIKRARICLF